MKNCENGSHTMEFAQKRPDETYKETDAEFQSTKRLQFHSGNGSALTKADRFIDYKSETCLEFFVDSNLAVKQRDKKYRLQLAQRQGNYLVFLHTVTK